MNKQVLQATFTAPPMNRTTRAAEGLPRWRWTTAELEKLVEHGLFPDDVKVELIGGSPSISFSKPTRAPAARKCFADRSEFGAGRA